MEAFAILFRVERSFDYTPCAIQIDRLLKKRNSQPIVRLHGRVICHMNGNFVGFQNMYDFKMSDP